MRSANHRQESLFPWVQARPTMDPDTILVTTMARDIMRPVIIGDLTGIVTTGIPIGGTDTGDPIDGTGIEILFANRGVNRA